MQDATVSHEYQQPNDGQFTIKAKPVDMKLTLNGVMYSDRHPIRPGHLLRSPMFHEMRLRPRFSVEVADAVVNSSRSSVSTIKLQ